jgi:hypothetical protein
MVNNQTADAIYNAFETAQAQHGQHAQLTRELRAILVRYYPQMNSTLTSFTASQKALQSVQAGRPETVGTSRFLNLKNLNPSVPQKPAVAAKKVEVVAPEAKVVKSEANETKAEINDVNELLGLSEADLAKFGRPQLQEIAIKGGWV